MNSMKWIQWKCITREMYFSFGMYFWNVNVLVFIIHVVHMDFKIE